MVLLVKCARKMRNAPSWRLGAGRLTLEVGHESWDVAPAHGARAAVHNDRKFVTALARGLEVLRVFTPTEGLLGNGEIAERTGLPKPTVSRLTYTLTKLGYLATSSVWPSISLRPRRSHWATRRSPISASASSPAPTCRR